MDLAFILVEPRVPENIGSAARAIKTMGFRKLCLVNPCDYKTGKAQWLAHGSKDILDKAKVFSNLKEAAEGYDLIIGTTTRHRISKSEYIEIGELKSFLEERQNDYSKIALVFGGEESGLSNSQMASCDITSNISMAVNYPLLNLSQAVMIYAYMLSDIDRNGSPGIKKNPEEASLKQLIIKINYLLSDTVIAKNKTLKGRIMERISLASTKDIRLIHSIINSLLKKYNKGQK